MKRKVCFIIGTRPEAIKIAPVSKLFMDDGTFDVINISTGQHKEMLYQVLNFFNISVHVELSVMQPNQTLALLSSSILEGLSRVLGEQRPDLVVVQGDTTTAHIGALAAFYLKIPVAHIEAGLRSFNLYSPFPEEANRKLISQLSSVHFCPTQNAVENLKAEGITANTHHVGNTVVDALLQAIELITKSTNTSAVEIKHKELLEKKFLLVTGHRRESFGEGFLNICRALRRVAEKFPDVNILYPVHLNPSVQEPVYALLSGLGNIHLSPPVDYVEMVWLLNRCHLVLTDSGGIQEEAPSLGKPILVMRDVTERMEGIDTGNAVLVGTEEDSIVNWTTTLLTDTARYHSMSIAGNPYGDGKSSERILHILKKFVG
jgi:UDP-N-acetylglucosamine 2-epimerase (non-hydrolysing)